MLDDPNEGGIHLKCTLRVRFLLACAGLRDYARLVARKQQKTLDEPADRI
jgi:hypothetical protein